jgi:hypothetical protein
MGTSPRLLGQCPWIDQALFVPLESILIQVECLRLLIIDLQKQ